MSFRLSIDPEVCKMLGVTEYQIAKMDLMTFAMLVFARGYDVKVSGFEAKGLSSGLTITRGIPAAAPDHC